MKRGEFAEAFNKASDKLDKRKLRTIIKQIVSSNATNDPKGYHNYIIVMEELAELSQQASKAGRGMLDKVGLIEEMADAAICLVKLQELCDIATLDLYKAINVKVDRLERVLKEKGIYL